MAAPPLTMADVPQVLQCLLAALQPGDVQKQAEAVVASMETRPGFISCLAEIMLNKEADHSARWLAAVQFKNMISKYWRQRPDPTCIQPDEKAHIRCRLPQLAVQEDNQIAVQVALAWAKVVRQDFPAQWPTLFTDLLAMLTAPGASQLSIRRTLLVLHHTSKELASKRLAADQRNFAQVSAQLFPPVWSQWVADTAALVTGLPALTGDTGTTQTPATQPLLITLERWLLLLKILRRLLVFGHVSDHKSLQPVQEVSVCAPAMLQALQQLVSLRPGQQRTGTESGAVRVPPQRNQLFVMLDRGLLKLVKVLVALQETHPWSFHGCGALLPTLSFCCDQCMAFILGVQSCPAYKGKTSLGTDAGDDAQDAPVKRLSAEVSQSLTGWWTPERLTSLTHALITGYGRLTARDLSEWLDSSEEFYHAGDISGWQEHVGLAAEALYLVLLTAHRGLLGPLVARLLSEADAVCPVQALVTNPAALPGGSVSVGHGASSLHVPLPLLSYDAVLSAVAKGAYELHDYVDYSTWLRGHLIPGTPLRILRRQSLRVVSAWVARLETSDRPAVYQAVLTCMAEDDLCIKLTSVACLHALIDDWNFEESVFEPYVSTAIQLLLQTLSGATELDSQTQAFNLLNLIIERMGDLIRPWVEPLAALLPGLWASAEGQSLLRIQVVLALQRLVNVLGPASPSLYQLLFPLLQYCTDPNQAEALHVLEDGLGLYLVAVRNAPTLQPQLLALIPHINAVMQGSTEHIAVCMAVLTSTALLARDHLTQYVQDVCSVFVTLLGNVNERGMLVLCPALESITAASPACIPGLRQAYSKLLHLIHSGQETPQVQASACCVLSRVLLLAPGELPQLLTGDANTQLAQLNKLIEIWTDTFDSLAQPRQRKLSALGLCALVAHLPSQPVLANIEVILGCITGVWAELEGDAPDASARAGGDGSWAVLAANDSGFEAELSVAVASEDAEGECTRRAELRASDPVPNASLRDALRGALERARTALGAALDAGLSGLDPTLGKQLHGMLASTSAPAPL